MFIKISNAFLGAALVLGFILFILIKFYGNKLTYSIGGYAATIFISVSLFQFTVMSIKVVKGNIKDYAIPFTLFTANYLCILIYTYLVMGK